MFQGLKVESLKFVVERQGTMKKFGMMLMMACGLALGATPQPSNTLASATDPTIRRPNRPAWRLPTYTLVARDMDLRTAFDTFAVHREADDPANVLGVAYGHLAEYDGYHSHGGTADEEAALPAAA